MRKFLISIFVISFSSVLFAQNDINLLDLIKDVPADTIAQQSLSQEPESSISTEVYDWRAQRHYVAVTYGTESIVYGMGWLVSMGETSWNTRIGPFTIDYGYNIKYWLRVGGGLRYTYGSRVNKLYNHHFDLVTRVDFTYLNRPKVKLYSGLGMGLAMHYVQQENDYNYIDLEPSFNLCVIGVHAGGDHVFFLGECNFGTSDALRVGIGCHF